MNLFSIVIISLIGLVVVGFLIDLFRSKPQPQEDEENRAVPLACDSGPTQTGRYKVQEMLQRTEKTEVASEESATETEEAEEEEDLPDPFDKS